MTKTGLLFKPTIGHAGFYYLISFFSCRSLCPWSFSMSFHICFLTLLNVCSLFISVPPIHFISMPVFLFLTSSSLCLLSASLTVVFHLKVFLTSDSLYYTFMPLQRFKPVRAWTSSSLWLSTSVTRKKSPNIYKGCPKII